MRANTNISLKERRQLKLTDFKGVDFSSSPLNVQQNRASDMSNFINEYGVNRKRRGWNELFRIEGKSINGIFYYSQKNRKDIIVHAGNRFYRVIGGKGDYSITNITPKIDGKEIELSNTRSQAFFGKGKMYIIGCGDYLVYGSWNNGENYELRRVYDNEDTYIPTTTISIDDDSVTKDDDSVTKDEKASLDDVNCLSPWRKNQLLGTSSSSATWTLDTAKEDGEGNIIGIPIDENSSVSILVYTMDGENPIKKTITNSGLDKTVLYEGDVSVGIVDFLKGKITLNIPTTPQISNRDNIYVTFKHTVEGHAERITKCNFGILFGTNGNTDRLFLSGNPDYPNIDFHSEADDYTYFGDLNTASMGSDSVAVNGYARLSDGTLVIYKEDNGQEASIFYRTGHDKEYYDKEGNIDKIVGVFPTSAGSIGEGAVSRYACANFGGDNLILSRNGVFGIVLANNVATAERYTRERSRSINERLKLHTDLSEAVAIVYKNRYYLAVDGVCYIADSRYKYTREDDIDGSYNYEWWYWDNIPARVWANIDNELYFGTSDGKVCAFDKEYTDRTYYTIKEKEISLDTSKNKVDYSLSIRDYIGENDIITFVTDGIYALYINEFTIRDNRVFVSEEDISYIQEGTEVYADNINGGSLSVNTPYFISGIDRGSCSFSIIDKEENPIILDGSFRLCKYISRKELYITNILTSSFQVKENKTSPALKLVSYNNSTPTDVTAKVTHKQNVVAKWYTPVFDLGTNESSKTLLKMTISTEAEVNGKLSFGYETRNASKYINAKGINIFSLENLSFENFSFDTGFASSYSVKVNERNFNFIMFRFVSDNDSDCAVNNFTIIYKINKQNKGVE